MARGTSALEDRPPPSPRTADPTRVESELRDLGVLPPPRERFRWIPLVRGGAEARRRWLIGVSVGATNCVVAGLLFWSCGSARYQNCGWALPLAAVIIVGTLVGYAMLGWFLLSLPALWENPRHPAADGQFAAGPTTFPSRDVVFDPSYDDPRRRE